MHLLCSMLCCPKQIEGDETVSAEKVNKNMGWFSSFVLLVPCTVFLFIHIIHFQYSHNLSSFTFSEVSRNYLNLYTVGRIATDYDRVETDRIYKNIVSLCYANIAHPRVHERGDRRSFLKDYRTLIISCMQ